jgi:hypothetical protein
MRAAELTQTAPIAKLQFPMLEAPGLHGLLSIKWRAEYWSRAQMISSPLRHSFLISTSLRGEKHAK